MLDRQTSPPKVPWTSLALLLLTYATFGWLLYGWTSNRSIWLASVFGVMMLGGFVSYPSRSVSLSFGGFFKTDVRALILILLASIGSVILLTWLQFFVDTVVLCTAGLLVSLDLKASGWRKSTAMFVIIGWQLLGMSVGLYAHYLCVHPPIDLPAYFYADYWFSLLDRLQL
ncbi:hypothetical protein [Chamaesiphon sp.]|uniref:hypothetical protein n=1 Tax=Chamaesiphon sp. TaxID=2814140 RepID=UPI0035943105